MTETDEIVETLDIEQWLDSEGIRYKKGRGSSGVQLNVKECPHCGNSNWKVYLNADTGLGNCFVCNEGFNKPKFIMLTLGLSWRDTMNRIRETLRQQGWKARREFSAAVDTSNVKLPLSFALPTPDGQNALYLEQRGFNGDMARYFHLRLSTMGWWNYKDENGNDRGQDFSNRIIIPVFDLDGELKTFQGRDTTGRSEKKYLFPSTLPGTGRYLLNGQNVVATKRIAIGEGFFDVAALKKAFDNNAELRDVIPVGTFGKHLSHGAIDGNDQLGKFIKLRARGVEEATMMWDGESAALIAALDAAKLLSTIGLRVRIALLPYGKDPNEISENEVYQSFFGAQLYTPALDIKFRLRNPYRRK